jgi:hypothetical protein
VFQHGFVENPVTWFLDEDHKAKNPVQETRKEKSCGTGLSSVPSATPYESLVSHAGTVDSIQGGLEHTSASSMATLPP